MARICGAKGVQKMAVGHLFVGPDFTKKVEGEAARDWVITAAKGPEANRKR